MLQREDSRRVNRHRVSSAPYSKRKVTIVQQTFESEMTVCHVVRLLDVNANQHFKWHKEFLEWSLTDAEDVFLLSCHQADPRIRVEDHA